MALSVNVDLRNACMELKRDYLQGGSLRLLASNDTQLASIGIAADLSGVVVSNGNLTLTKADGQLIPCAAADSTPGTIAKASVYDSAGTAIITGLTVGLQGDGSNVQLSRLEVLENDEVSANTFSLTEGNA